MEQKAKWDRWNINFDKKEAKEERSACEIKSWK